MTDACDCNNCRVVCNNCRVVAAGGTAGLCLKIPGAPQWMDEALDDAPPWWDEHDELALSTASPSIVGWWPKVTIPIPIRWRLRDGLHWEIC